VSPSRFIGPDTETVTPGIGAPLASVTVMESAVVVDAGEAGRGFAGCGVVTGGFGVCGGGGACANAIDPQAKLNRIAGISLISLSYGKPDNICRA
jgi:hypothetical protein